MSEPIGEQASFELRHWDGDPHISPEICRDCGLDGSDCRCPAPITTRENHLTECYMRQFPQDEGVYCTCLDWSPEA